MPVVSRRRSTQYVQPVPVAALAPAGHMRAAIKGAHVGMEHTRASLIRDMRQMQHNLEHAIRRLEQGRALSALGELQGSATMIDAKCGTLAAQHEAYERLTALAARLGPATTAAATGGEV